MKDLVKIIIEDGDKVLQHYFLRVDTWGVPAGKIEENELPRNAAVRELLERTGFDIEPDKLVQTEDEAEFFLYLKVRRLI